MSETLPNERPREEDGPSFVPSPAHRDSDSSLLRMSTSPGCSLVSEMDKPLESPCVILVPRVAALKEGSKLVGPVVLGRLLGSGLQARVHELVLTDGTPTGKVIKIAHRDIGHKALNAIWISMEREWELGLQLRAALQDSQGKLPGFLRVCDAIVSGDPSATQSGKRRARFAGMILEKLNGWEVYKRVEVPEFHNIHYVKEMLKQVFTSLDRAERETGFFHADMGMRNIMEHYPEVYDDVEEQERRRNLEAEMYGVTPAESVGEPKSLVNQVNAVNHPPQQQEQPPQQYPDGAACHRRVRARAGYTCNADGARMPLGPNIEFKIIDYGSSCFSETLAQATGGFRSRKNYERLRRLFESREVAFASATQKTFIEVETAAGNPETQPGKKWKLLPTGLRQRFKLKSVPKGTEPVPTAGGAANSAPNAGNQVRANGGTDEGGVPERLQSFSAASSGRGDRPTRVYAVRREDTMPSAPSPPRMSPIEKMYRQFWRRKGDVFHLLLGMAVVLDDRIWPSEDKEDVLLFVSLVHHVTGVKLKASFAAENEPAVKGRWGRMGRLTRFKKEKYGTKGTWSAWFRRVHIRLKAHLYPYNSGLTAGQALVAPFFQEREPRVPPASEAVPLAAVFPRWE